MKMYKCEEKKAINLLKTYQNKLVYEIEEKDKKAINTVLNLITKLQKEIENQKTELAILNEKQKDMNRLINTVKSYKGQFNRQEKELQKYKYLYQKALDNTVKSDKENIDLKKQIDLMVEEYEYNARINFKNFCEDELRKDSCIQDCKLCAKQYFEKLAKEKGE